MFGHYEIVSFRSCVATCRYPLCFEILRIRIANIWVDSALFTILLFFVTVLIADALTSPSIVADEQPIDTNNNKNINNDEATFIEDEYINFILSKLYEKKMQLENVIEEVDLKIDTIKAEVSKDAMVILVQCLFSANLPKVMLYLH